MGGIRKKPGEVFGSWELIEYRPETKRWLARCGGCGKEKEVWIGHLVRGTSKHCGSCGRKTHGMTGNKAYVTWDKMHQRCFNEKNERYPHYGGRGITVCERWRLFANFASDMGERPEGMSLDRIDVNGNYEPGNCRWATDKEQQRNRRNNRLFTLFGKTQTLAEWCEEFGVSVNRVSTRLHRNWDIYDALTTGNVQGQRGYRTKRKINDRSIDKMEG